MYVGVGNSSIAACAANQARLYRTDRRTDDTNRTRAFTDLTAVQQASSAPNQTMNYCGDPAVGGAQCWYDNVVYSPPGKPDVVYLGGSFNYTNYGFRNNGRAFIRSTNAGVTFHRYDLGRDDEPDSARHVLSAESDRAEWNASRQSRDRRDPGNGLRDLRLGRWAGSVERSFRGHLISM